jgi:hypothetical protein
MTKQLKQDLMICKHQIVILWDFMTNRHNFLRRKKINGQNTLRPNYKTDFSSS